MRTSENEFLNKPFSHIYVEDEARNYAITEEILGRFRASQCIAIKHYKDIFNRNRQDFFLQKQSPALILAVKKGELVYPGARVCQSFGNDNFYYTSNIMNCIYDCEYCYLQGMYPGGNIVIFVNQEDIFKKVKELLMEGNVYLCVSYDTDLLALEGMTGFTKKWIDFTLENPGLKIEIRTKSAYSEGFSHFPKCDRVIFAWTLSPEEIIRAYEHHTPGLQARLSALRSAMDSGYRTRLCFDPMIYVKNYREIYAKMYGDVFSAIDAGRVLDISLGVFRISSGYLKSLRKSRRSLIGEYPYANIDGICSYEEKKSREMLDFARLEISKYIDVSKIYTDH